MRTFIALMLFSAALSLTAQDGKVIPLSSEPHHHLALHNDYVNVYKVGVAPHDKVLLHRHVYDAISVMLADAEVSVSSPDKPVVESSLAAGQIRLQARGYVHSTSIEGQSEYRNITIELLLPQSGEHNLCSVVLAGQPKHCPEPTDQKAPGIVVSPQFATDQTAVTLMTLSPHQSFESHSDDSQLIVALNDVAIAGKVLHTGEFVWVAQGQRVGSVQNKSDHPSRLVGFTFHSDRSK